MKTLKSAPMLALVAAALCTTAIGARADLSIVTKIDDKVQHAYVAPHLLSAEGDAGRLIFRGDKQVLWMLKPDEKTYAEMTKEDAATLGAKVNQAMAQMQEALKNAPPEQRAALEQMLKGKLEAPEVKRTIKPIGQVKEINGFECTGYTATKSDGSSTEVWSADLQAANLQPDDLDVFKDLGSFMGTLMPQVSGFQEMVKDFAHPSDSDVPGFPVLTIERDKDGKELWRAEVVSIGHARIPADRFEVPPDYKKEKMPGM